MNPLVRTGVFLALPFGSWVPAEGEQPAPTRDAVIAAMRPYDGPSAKSVDASTLTGKVLCGYQGWFTAPSDGSDRGWRHYPARGQFKPGSCSIDLWPDVSELDKDEKIATPFRHRDGRVGEVFSSHHAKTVLRHFRWMEQYGIGGVFVQRFAVETVQPKNLRHCNTVLAHCREGANRSGRCYAVMYDLSGLPAGGTRRVIDDWKLLVGRMKIGRDPKDAAYLRHQGKPVVAVWGVGFNDGRKYTLDECEQLVDFLKNDKDYGGCTVLLGVPTGWRALDRDSVKNPALHRIIAKADIVSPWTVGRYRSLQGIADHARQKWAPDGKWCKDRGKEYLPVVFPGFSWHNLRPKSPLNEIPRQQGRFLWKQVVEAKKAGATMLYVAMFDEMDEGTAIFKCTNDPPVGASKFLTLEGLPSDYYLWLTGMGGKLLRGEVAARDELPVREKPKGPKQSRDAGAVRGPGKYFQKGDQGVEITWDAEADFESGIRGFIVLRDGRELAKVPQTPVGKFGRPLFQSMTYHDTPAKPLPEMRYVDASARAGARHTYAVITVNGVGLKSEPAAELPRGKDARRVDYHFDKTISRQVLENYLARAISMEGLLNGKGDLDDNIRMLKDTGAKFIGRALCLWAGEANLLKNLERARRQVPLVHKADPEMILQACVFEIVTTNVEKVPVPHWAFQALGLPVETRNFRYADMLYPDGKRRNHWGRGASVPDVSRPETKLWFYFLAASYIDLGCEAIHFGQTELMNGNDRGLAHYKHVLTLIRAHAAKHARRHMVVCDAHVPSGGLVREGRLLMDFHSFPLRIKEVPDRPQEAVLQVGFSDSIYRRSKGGLTFSGWQCDHLPYLVEIDNWGASKQPGKPRQGGIWVWGYDEISWFANQSKPYRADWLRYAWHWVRSTDPNGFLQMPGSRTVRSPLDRRRWYFANVPSRAVPDGLGDEVAIRAIWAADRANK